MAGTPQILVKFLADTSALSKGFKEAGASSQTFGSSLKKVGKTALIAGGAAGLAGLAATLKIGVDEFSEAAQVAAQTEARLKSTGKAAHVTAGHVAGLAEALMQKSGTDDEAIQSGENLLLTFTNIRNEAGKGNAIFDQATKTMLNMSIALGQDTKNSAIQLGKALQDPIKGVTALQRVGVNFNEAQKEQIKTMVESGDMLGAQKLILAELNKEFGTSAEAAGKTLPGQINILKQSFSNLAGEMVGVFAPALQTVARFLTEHPALFKAMVIGVLALAAAMVALNVALAVTAAVTAGIAAPVLIAIAALAALIAIAVLVVKHWDEIKSATLTAWNAARTAVTTAVNAIRTAISSVIGWIRSNWPLLLPILIGPIGVAAAVIIRHWSTIRAATTAAWNAIKSVVSIAVSGITAAFNVARSAASALSGVVTHLAGALRAAGSAASAAAAIFRGVLTAAANIAKRALDGLAGIAHAIAGAFSAAAGAASSLASAIRSIPSRIHLPSIPHLPNIPGLQAGGIVRKPTLAVVGERGPEAVIPLSQMGSVQAGGVGAAPIEVHVYIGDTELKGMVRTEVVRSNTGLARGLLAGSRQ